MQFFIDTANIEEIIELNDIGLVDGVTTNPSLIAKSGRDFIKTITEISTLIKGSVSAEVTSLDVENMIREGEKLCAIADNITVKLPLTWDGLKACRHFANQDREVNMTLCFSAAQAILAAKAGAAFVSPFVGRLDDISQNGLGLIEEICQIYSNYYYETEIIVASIRNPIHIIESAKIGADICTIPPLVAKQLINHPLTKSGLETFTKDWKKTGQII